MEEVPKKEHDQYWLKLKMVGVNAVAVTQTQVYVIQTIVQVLMKHTHYTKQNLLLLLYVILISQLIANGVHGAIGTVARQAVDGALKKDTDLYLFLLNMVEMDALAVPVNQNGVGREVHVGREVGGAG